MKRDEAARPGPTGTRQERGDSSESGKRPSHVTVNEDDAEIQEAHPHPRDVAALPANASGRDKVSTDEAAQPVDEESMYDNRPSQDKDRPPSSGDRS